jgi:hypothetical protein
LLQEFIARFKLSFQLVPLGATPLIPTLILVCPEAENQEFPEISNAQAEDVNSSKVRARHLNFIGLILIQRDRSASG